MTTLIKCDMTDSERNFCIRSDKFQNAEVFSRYLKDNAPMNLKLNTYLSEKKSVVLFNKPSLIAVEITREKSNKFRFKSIAFDESVHYHVLPTPKKQIEKPAAETLMANVSETNQNIKPTVQSETSLPVLTPTPNLSLEERLKTSAADLKRLDEKSLIHDALARQVDKESAKTLEKFTKPRNNFTISAEASEFVDKPVKHVEFKDSGNYLDESANSNFKETTDPFSAFEDLPNSKTTLSTLNLEMDETHENKIKGPTPYFCYKGNLSGGYRTNLEEEDREFQQTRMSFYQDDNPRFFKQSNIKQKSKNKTKKSHKSDKATNLKTSGSESESTKDENDSNDENEEMQYSELVMAQPYIERLDNNMMKVINLRLMQVPKRQKDALKLSLYNKLVSTLNLLIPKFMDAKTTMEERFRILNDEELINNEKFVKKTIDIINNKTVHTKAVALAKFKNDWKTNALAIKSDKNLIPNQEYYLNMAQIPKEYSGKYQNINETMHLYSVQSTSGRLANIIGILKSQLATVVCLQMTRLSMDKVLNIPDWTKGLICKFADINLKKEDVSLYEIVSNLSQPDIVNLTAAAGITSYLLCDHPAAKYFTKEVVYLLKEDELRVPHLPNYIDNVVKNISVKTSAGLDKTSETVKIIRDNFNKQAECLKTNDTDILIEIIDLLSLFKVRYMNLRFQLSVSNTHLDIKGNVTNLNALDNYDINNFKLLKKVSKDGVTILTDSRDTIKKSNKILCPISVLAPITSETAPSTSKTSESVAPAKTTIMKSIGEKLGTLNLTKNKSDTSNLSEF